MLIRQTLLYVPSQFLGPAAQLVAMVLWTHLLSPADVGVITIFFATRDILLNLSGSWWTSYTGRYIAGERDRSGHDSTERVVVVVGTVVRTLVLMVFFWVSGYPAKPILYVVAAAQVATEALVMHGTVRFWALGRIGPYTALMNLGSLIGVPLGLVLAWLFDDKVVAVLSGYVIGQLVAVLATRSIGPYVSTPSRPAWDLIPRALRYSLPLVAGSLCAWVSTNFIRFVIERQAGLEALGVFTPGWTVGLRIVDVVSLFVTTAAFPLALAKLREEGRSAAVAQMGQNTVLLLATMAPASLGLVLVGPHLAVLLFKEGFATMAATIIPIAAACGFVRCLRLHFPDQSFLVFEQSYRNLVVAAFDSVGAIGLCSLGLFLGGVVGAALGMMAAAVLSLLLSFGLSRYSYGIGVPLVPVLKILTATCAMWIAGLVLPTPAGILSMAFFIGACALAYGAALGLLFGRQVLEVLPHPVKARLMRWVKA
jgi:O-antigen/teichoic acid export membrane protein